METASIVVIALALAISVILTVSVVVMMAYVALAPVRMVDQVSLPSSRSTQGRDKHWSERNVVRSKDVKKPRSFSASVELLFWV